MESKLLAGGENIFDKTNEQERELERQRQEMIDQKKKERAMKQELLAKEETTMEIKETYTSLQEEVDHKTKKLNKLRSKLKSVRSDIDDLKLEQADARQELLLTLENLHKEVKLRSLIVQNFIPPDVTTRMKERTVYDEEEETWSLKPLEIGRDESGPEFKRPVSALGNIRPIATHARMAARTGNPRYKAENILQLELDMPMSTTRDYEGGGMAPIVQAVLDAALNEEKDITIDANAIEEVTGGLGVPRSHQRNAKKGRKRKPSKEGTSELKKSENFPVTRGLVQPSVRFA
jgi:kinesin family protein 3/17